MHEPGGRLAANPNPNPNPDPDPNPEPYPGRLAAIGGGLRAGDATLPGAALLSGGGRRRRGPSLVARRARGHARRRGEGLQAVGRGGAAATARRSAHSGHVGKQ